MVGHPEREGDFAERDAFGVLEADSEADDPVVVELAFVAVVVDVLRRHEVRAQRGLQGEEPLPRPAGRVVEANGEDPVEQAVEEGDERAYEPSGRLGGGHGGGVRPQCDFHTFVRLCHLHRTVYFFKCKKFALDFLKILDTLSS